MGLGRNALIVFGLVVGMGGAAAWGGAVPVLNNSFESPNVPLADIAAPGADNWATTGGANTGIFPNLPQDIDFGGVIAKRITNADQNQLAFIAAIYDPTGTTDNGVPLINEFSQLLTTTYLPGNSYSLSVGVTTSSVQPPNVGSKLRLELYYLSNNVRQIVGSTLVSSDDASVQNELLKYYTVNVPVVGAGDAFANQPIGILISTADNSPATGGTFDFDNVTLNAVPEPASIGVIGISTLALGFRRRKA